MILSFIFVIIGVWRLPGPPLGSSGVPLGAKVAPTRLRERNAGPLDPPLPKWRLFCFIFATCFDRKCIKNHILFLRILGLNSMNVGSILNAFWDVFSLICSIPFSMRFCMDFGSFLQFLNLDSCNTLYAKTRFFEFCLIPSLFKNDANNDQYINKKWCQNQSKIN